MAGLIDLKNQMDAAQTSAAPPSGERVYTKIPSPSLTVPMGAKVPIRGDDLMAQAAGYNQVSNEEDRFASLYRQSQAIVGQRADSDPEYAKTVMPEFQKAHSKGIDAFANKMIDEADRVKVEYLRRENPDWFTGAEAAKFGFFNSATFGQLTKIMGKAGEMIQGRPYEEVVQEQAERMRLLEKAYPGSFTAGNVGAYLIPGSPAKALFEKAASFGGKALATLLPKLAANPSLLATVGQSAAAGAAGSAAIGGVTGTLGTDLQSLSLDRGAETALSTGAAGALVGGAIPVAAKGVQMAASKAAPYIQAAAQNIQSGVGRALGEISGVSPEALRAYNADAAKLAKAYGTEASVGADLVDTLHTYNFSNLPEVKQANEILSAIPDTDASGMLRFLSSVKRDINPGKDAQVALVEQWTERIGKQLQVDPAAPGQTKVNSSSLREIIDTIQKANKDTYDKEAPFAAQILKQAGRIGRLAIIDTAKTQGGEAGQLYAGLMEKASQKRDVLKFITRQLGQDADKQAVNAERFISNLFGKNKELVQQRMGELDQIFGTNFLEQAQNASFAKQVGPEGVPKWVSSSPTGRSVLGTALGAAVGAGVGAATGEGAGKGALVGGVLSSPRAAAGFLGASDAITGFVTKMTQNPAALARIAGQLGPAAAAGSDQAAKALARLRVPMQVQHLANQVYTALIKDGPVSAGSMTRLIADTPYFFPLAHYYELADRQMKSKDLQQGMARLQQGASPQIATPRGQ